MTEDTFGVQETQADPRTLTSEQIGRVLSALPESKNSSSRRVLGLKSYEAAIDWIKIYAKNESKHLDKKFVSSRSVYDFLIIVDRDKNRARFDFRLRTVGLAGGTQYGIEVRRVGQEYLCRE